MPYVFTPPTIPDVPTTSEFERSARRDGTVTNEYAVRQANPQGSRLMGFYKPRRAGVAVFKMSDGTWRTDRMVPQGPTLETAWPPVPIDQQVNGAISQSWLYNEMIDEYVQDPAVVTVYYGGMSHPVSDAEAADLINGGFGPYLEVVP